MTAELGRFDRVPVAAMLFLVFAGKPIIGIAGGIGSGKSHVARVFRELGCLVIDSDAQVRDAYRDARVKETLRSWWGDGVFTPAGEINRSAIASKVFADPAERARLERLLHPLVKEARDRVMESAVENPQVLAFVWDTPLLFETRLNCECDVVVFVETPWEQRLRRVRAGRGWEATELARRENLQWPLDRKRQVSDYVVTNTADEDVVGNPGEAGPADVAHTDTLRELVRQVLSRILARR